MAIRAGPGSDRNETERMALPNAQTRRFTRDEYYQMADSGIFAPDERVELIDGEIVSMPAQNLPHATSVAASNMALVAKFSATHIVRCQLPVTLAEDCEPEPDFSLVTRAHLRECAARGWHPSLPDLILEISDRSLGYDRGEKVGVFARAGVPEYWILNVQKRCLEVRRDPTPDADSPFGHTYASIRLVPEGADVSPLFAPDLTVRVVELLEY